VGALADRFSATFCVTIPLIVTVDEPNVIVAPTVTGALAVVYPVPDAEMFAEPRFTPVTVGCVAGVVAPALIVTLADEIVTFVVSLLDRFTVTALGAGVGRVTANVAVLPNPSDVLAGSRIIPGAWSVI
jgi:hypothetical protein